MTVKSFFFSEHAGASPDHLMVERQRFGRPIQDDRLHRGLVEAGGQNADRGEDGIRLFVEPRQDVLPFLFGVGVVEVPNFIAFLLEQLGHHQARCGCRC